MNRLQGAAAGQARKAAPDVYSVLLLIGVMFLVTAIVVVVLDLTKNYGLGVAELIQGPSKLPR